MNVFDLAELAVSPKKGSPNIHHSVDWEEAAILYRPGEYIGLWSS